jgi:hypothetical protein
MMSDKLNDAQVAAVVRWMDVMVRVDPLCVFSGHPVYVCSGDSMVPRLHYNCEEMPVELSAFCGPCFARHLKSLESSDGR